MVVARTTVHIIVQL